MRIANGVGVAGPALAYWLRRSGQGVLLVEEAPRLRAGGYLIDFWGLGYVPFLSRQQPAAARFAASYAPRTALGVAFRNRVSRLIRIPCWRSTSSAATCGTMSSCPTTTTERIVRSA